MKPLQFNLLKTIIVILCFSMTGILSAQSPQIPSTDPICGTDLRMQMSISATPNGQIKWDEKEQYLTNYVRYLQNKQGSGQSPVLGEDYFVIPVVFHVIHSASDAVGVGSNIAYEQIISQMNVLNEEFGGGDQGEPTGISFCLARNPSPSSAGWFDENEPGVRRYSSNTATLHEMSYAGEISLMGLTHPDYGSSEPDYFPYSKYLNIWVVSSIAATGDGTVMGYGVLQPAEFNASTESGLDGIVMRHDAIGSSEDGSFNLFPGANLGKVLVHEVGHYLGLYHTFHLGCTGIPADGSAYDCLEQGDRVCDTPPQNGFAQSLCNSGSHLDSQGNQIGNTCTDHLNWASMLTQQTQNYIQLDANGDAYDLLEAHMGYSLDACRKTFTFGQAQRMQAQLSTLRSGLSTTSNLVFTGIAGGDACIPPILVADILMNDGLAYQLCLGTEANFSTPTGAGYSATSWAWNFGDGSPVVSGSSVTHTYTVAGVYNVTLTATDESENEVSQTVSMYVPSCQLGSLEKAHWVYGYHVAIDFSSGLPQFSDIAMNPPANDYATMVAREGSISVSDEQTGELLFYSNGFNVWDAEGHVLGADLLPYTFVPSETNCISGGLSDQSSSSLAYCPVPNHPNEYYIFVPTLIEVLDLGFNGIHCIRVDLNAGEFGEAVYQELITNPVISMSTGVYENIKVIPHCNGTDYWLLIGTHMSLVMSPINVVLISELGLSNSDMTSNSWEVANFQPDIYDLNFEMLAVSTDGERIYGLQTDATGFYKYGALCDFDRSTGTISFSNTYPSLVYSHSYPFACFSPNNQYVYTSLGIAVSRIEIVSGEIEFVVNGNYTDMEMGPEAEGSERLYLVNPMPAKRISAINAPNDPINPGFQMTALSWTECPDNMFRFPSFIYGRSYQPVSLEIEVEYLDCSTVSFVQINSSCYETYQMEWDFGDGQTATGNNVEHTYTDYGTYTVTLTASRNAWTPLTQTVMVTVGQPQVGSIYAAPANVCVGNNQELAVSELAGIASYQWSIDEGGQFTNGELTAVGSLVTAFWTSSGIHTVTLTGVPTNSYCQSSSASLSVNVWDSPVATLSVSEQPCIISVDLTGGAMPYENSTWYNGAGNIIQQGGGTYGPVGNGVYQYSALDANGCVATTSITIMEGCWLCPAPTTDLSISHGTECFYVPGATIQFYNATTTPGATFHWSFGTGLYSSLQNPTFTYNSPGIYDVDLTITTPNCPDEHHVQTTITIGFDYPDAVQINSTAQAAAYASTWHNNTHTFGQDIVFGDGTTSMSATISDATFILGPGVRIVISENANVTFNRCTFTSCSTWEGFEVLSNSATHAAPGILRIDHLNLHLPSYYSTIEYARIGIKTRDSRPDASYQLPSSLQGGTIYCGRTRFINCKQAFDVKEATSKVSWFKLCLFRVNNDIAQHFPHNTGSGYNQMEQQCKHYRSIGYNYYGCSWENTMDAFIKGWENRGKAINIGWATVTITRYANMAPTTHINGNIKGFDYGVYQGLKGGTIMLSYQTFEQNHIGAFFSRGIADRVYKNTFTIGKATGVEMLDNDEQYGTFPESGNSGNIDVDLTTSYEGLVVQYSDLVEIAENTLTGVPDNEGGVHSQYPRIGIRIRSTYTLDMVVRKNTLSKLNYANLANGDNAGGLGGTSGLRYICNTNSRNQWDFTNTDFVGVPNAAEIGLVQQEHAGTVIGQPSFVNWPTGNVFSVDPNSNIDTYIHFRNDGGDVRYLHNNAISQTPTDYYQIGLIMTNAEHTCPAKYTDVIIIKPPVVISGLIDAGMITKDEALLYEYAYLLLLDGGNTEALKDFVAHTWGSEVWATREELLSISPFVTDEVLYKVLDNTAVYSHAIAFEILLANPDVLRDPRMVCYLSDKPDPMPEYLIDLLLAYASGSTARTEMEEELGGKRTRHITNVSEALWAMMDYYEDDTYTEEDFYHVIDSIGTLTSEIAMVEWYLNKGDIAIASQRTSEIPGKVRFGRGEEREYYALRDWVELRSSMLSAGRDWEHITSTDSTALMQLLEHFDTHAAAQAMAVLNEYKGTDYFIPPAYGENNLVKRAKLSHNEINSQLVTVYPNPADYIATIKLKEVLPTGEICRLVITDILGREVENYLINPEIRQYPVNTKDWAVGIYAFKIVVPNSPIEISGKINVAR